MSLEDAKRLRNKPFIVTINPFTRWMTIEELSTSKSVQCQYPDMGVNGTVQLGGRTIGYNVGYSQHGKDEGFYCRIYDDVDSGLNYVVPSQIIVEYEMQQPLDESTGTIKPEFRNANC